MTSSTLPESAAALKTPHTSPHAYVIDFRQLAHGYWVSFFGTFALGGILTFTVTEYQPSTDMIYRFYNKFNPCIFFDHYPASLMASLGMISMVSFQIFEVAFVHLHQSALAHEYPDDPVEGDLWQHLTFVPFVGPLILVYACFANVFTSNMYVDGYKSHNSTHHALLFTNATPDEIDGITAKDFAAVSNHTMWFCLWMVADIVFWLFVNGYVGRLRRTRSMAFPDPSRKDTNCCWCWRRDSLTFRIARPISAAMYFFSMAVFDLALFAMLLGYDGENRFRTGLKNPNAPFVQVVVGWLQEVFKPHLWFFVAMTAAPLFAVPAGLGLEFNVSLVSHSEKGRARTMKGMTGQVRPLHMLSRAFQVLMALVVFTFLFTPADFHDENVTPLASGFRVRPWTFLFLPVWLLLTLGVICAASFSIARLTLMDNVARLRVMVSSALAVLMVCLFLFGAWIVIPQLPNTRWIGSALPIVLALFVGSVHLELENVVVDSQGSMSRWRRGAQAAFWLACLVTGICSSFSIVASVLFVCLLAVYGDLLEYLSPELPALGLDVRVVGTRGGERVGGEMVKKKKAAAGSGDGGLGYFSVSNREETHTGTSGFSTLDEVTGYAVSLRAAAAPGKPIAGDLMACSLSRVLTNDRTAEEPSEAEETESRVEFSRDRGGGCRFVAGMAGRSVMVERAKNKALNMRAALRSPYSRIFDYLYLGKDPGAAGGELPPGTTHILNLTRAATYEAPAGVRVLHFPIADEESAAPALIKAAPKLCAFIETARIMPRGGVCYCHCRAGISRSATVVLYYLMTSNPNSKENQKTLSLAQALTYLRKKRPVVSPNVAFMAALCREETKLRGRKPSIDITRYRQHGLTKLK
eukprot:g3337.t1